MARERVRAALLARIRAGKPINRAAVEAEQPRVAYSVSRAHPVWSEALASLALPV